MNYNEIICEYINRCNLDEPLFLEEIKQYVINEYKKEISFKSYNLRRCWVSLLTFNFS